MNRRFTTKLLLFVGRKEDPFVALQVHGQKSIMEVAERPTGKSGSIVTNMEPLPILQPSSSPTRSADLARTAVLSNPTMTVLSSETYQQSSQQRQHPLPRRRPFNELLLLQNADTDDTEHYSVAASDSSPMISIRLEERYFLAEAHSRGLSGDDYKMMASPHRVWDDVKRRLHMLNVYLGIDTDEDETFSHLFDDGDGDDLSSYAASERTLTTVASSTGLSSVQSFEFEYDNEMMIRRIESC